jgi:outer membrane protein assembly factor BamB
VPVVGLAAACGSAQHAPTTTTTAKVAPPPARAPAGVRHTPRHRHYKGATLIVYVLDGDLRVRVRHARVRLAGRIGMTGRHGGVGIFVHHRRPLPVTVTARGFESRTVYETFRHSRRVTIRVYRPQLQWPLYGVIPTRTQAQTHIRLRPPFRTVWSLDIGGLIEFPAVVQSGVAYIGNARGTIRAVSMRFGGVMWRHDTHTHAASSPAVWRNEVVYHTMGDGRVHVLDRRTGNERWSFDAGSPIESSPVVRHGVDYFGAWNGRLYALDLRTHRLRWSRELGAKMTGSATISGHTLYIGDYAGRVWALWPGNGATRWVRSVNGRVYGTVAVSAGRLFVPSSTGNSLTAFSTRGRELWRVGTGGYVYSSPAVWHGVVAFGSYDGHLYGVSASSGRLLWRVWAGGPISGAAVVVDGIAYAGSFGHRIVGVSAASGRQVLTFGHGEYVPVSGNGMRLLFHGYSRLYAVEPRPVSKHRHRRAVTRPHSTHTRHLRRNGR